MIKKIAGHIARLFGRKAQVKDTATIYVDNAYGLESIGGVPVRFELTEKGEAALAKPKRKSSAKKTAAKKAPAKRKTTRKATAKKKA